MGGQTLDHDPQVAHKVCKRPHMALWNYTANHKKCATVFDYNSCVSWTSFVPVETGMNTVHLLTQWPDDVIAASHRMSW